MDRADLTFGGSSESDDCAKETELYSLKQELKNEKSERENAFWAFADAAYKECTRGTFSAETIKKEFDVLCEINARIVALEERINLAESREEREKDRTRQILEAQKSKLAAAELVEQSKAAADEAMKKALELQEELERAQEKAKEAEAEEQKLLDSVNKTELVEVVPNDEEAEIESDDSIENEDLKEELQECLVDSTEDISVPEVAVADEPAEDDILTVDSESEEAVVVENNSVESEQEVEPEPEPAFVETELESDPEPEPGPEPAEYESIFDKLVHKEEAPKTKVEPTNVDSEPEPEPAPEPATEVAPQHFNICPNCGAEFEAGCKFCGLCGSKLPDADSPSEPKHCMSCGKPLEPGASFCIYCGAHV